MSIFLSLGSNIYPRKKNIDKGINLLANNQINILKESSLYETDPMYIENQNKFLNKVIEVNTNKQPLDLLLAIKFIEYIGGRDFNQVRNGPRVIDIDILCYRNRKISNKLLTIPHRKIKERKFILKPWVEICPDYLIYGYTSSVKKLLKKIDS